MSKVNAAVGIDVQRVFLSLRANTTEVVTQVAVPSTSDYGVLIPLPAQPTLDPMPVSNEELNDLDAMTAPDIRVREASEDTSCGCPFVAGSDTKGAPSRGAGLQVSLPVDIGPVTAVVLSGEDDEAVKGWLDEHGFAIPVSHASVFDAYAGPGRYFVALRRNSSAGPGPSSVGVHFTVPGDQRTLPLRFASLGAGPTVAFTVFVAAPEIVGPAPPFVALTLDQLDADFLAAEDYAGAVADAVENHGFRAFVIESAHPRTALEGVAPRLLQLTDANVRLTRLTTVLPSDALTDDVDLNATVATPVPNFRVVFSLMPQNLRTASAGLILGALLIVRRRRRVGGREMQLVGPESRRQRL